MPDTDPEIVYKRLSYGYRQRFSRAVGCKYINFAAAFGSGGDLSAFADGCDLLIAAQITQPRGMACRHEFLFIIELIDSCLYPEGFAFFQSDFRFSERYTPGVRVVLCTAGSVGVYHRAGSDISLFAVSDDPGFDDRFICRFFSEQGSVQAPHLITLDGFDLPAFYDFPVMIAAGEEEIVAVDTADLCPRQPECPTSFCCQFREQHIMPDCLPFRVNGGVAGNLRLKGKFLCQSFIFIPSGKGVSFSFRIRRLYNLFVDFYGLTFYFVPAVCDKAHFVFLLLPAGLISTIAGGTFVDRHFLCTGGKTGSCPSGKNVVFLFRIDQRYSVFNRIRVRIGFTAGQFPAGQIICNTVFC